MEDNFAMGYALGQDSGGSNGNNGFGFGSWGDLAALLVVAGLFGGGGWGFGGFGGGGGAGLQGIATRADINEGFALQNITSGITGITNGLCDGFHNMTVGMMNGFNGVQTAINGIGHQISDCCCATGRAIDGVNYNMATQFAALNNNLCGISRDIIDNQNANTRSIMDFLVNDKIATLTAENQSLKFAASQANQNAFFVANQEAQTAELIRRLGPTPVPAYTVPAPYPYCGNGYNSGCGCGCGCAA